MTDPVEFIQFVCILYIAFAVFLAQWRGDL